MSPLCVIAKEAPYVTEAWHYDWDQRSARCMHSLSTSRHRKSWLRSFLLQKTIKLFSQQQHLGNYRNHLRSPVSFFPLYFQSNLKAFLCTSSLYAVQCLVILGGICSEIKFVCLSNIFLWPRGNRIDFLRAAGLLGRRLGVKGAIWLVGLFSSNSFGLF